MTEAEQHIVDNAFQLLAKNTELSLLEYTLITQCQADIEQSLRQHINRFSTTLYGSFLRKSIVSPLSDSIVDMLIVFSEQDISNVPPSRVFEKLYETLIQHYPDAQAIKTQSTIILSMKDIHYKIRPAYALSSNTYMLPDENFNEWTKYDINAYSEIFTKENATHKNKLLEVIRLVKTWNRVSGNFFNGYYLELLVTQVLSSYEITNYPETLRYIFKAVLPKSAFQQHDPANVEFMIDGLNNMENLISAMQLIKKSYILTNEAIEFEQGGETDKALNSWIKLFPQVFPTQLDMAVGRTRNSGIKGADALRMLLDQKKA